MNILIKNDNQSKQNLESNLEKKSGSIENTFHAQLSVGIYQDVSN